jgi:hypothetical protein
MTPSETASRIVVGITSKVDLDHNTQAVMFIEVGNGIEKHTSRQAWLIRQLATCLSLFDNHPSFDDEMAALIRMAYDLSPPPRSTTAPYCTPSDKAAAGI